MRDRRMPLVMTALMLAASTLARADQTDDYIKAQMQAFHLSGLSLAIVKNGDVILTEAARREMWTPVRLNDGTTSPYGLGWHVDSRERRRVWHGGGLPGFSAHFARYLDEKLTVIVLTNGEDVDLPTIANGIAVQYLPAATQAQ